MRKSVGGRLIELDTFGGHGSNKVAPTLALLHDGRRFGKSTRPCYVRTRLLLSYRASDVGSRRAVVTHRAMANVSRQLGEQKGKFTICLWKYDYEL